MNNTLTKKSRQVICRDIVNKYRPGETISKEDEMTLRELSLTHHPLWPIIEEGGIEHLEVHLHEKYKTKGLRAVKPNGEKWPISYRDGIYMPGGSLQKYATEQIKHCCREAIEPEVERLRQNTEFPCICPVDGTVISTSKDAHVDHYDLPFDEVFKKWMENKDAITIFYTAIDWSFKSAGERFADDRMRENFVKFHNANTHLRIVSKHANLVTLRKRDI